MDSLERGAAREVRRSLRALAANRAPARARSSASGLAFAAGGSDLGVGDLVGEQGVDLGGLGRGVAQAAAHHLDGHAAVDQLAGVRVAELVDADPGVGGGAVLLPPVVRRVVGQRAAPAVDGLGLP